MLTAGVSVDRAALGAWYRRNRARTRGLFDVLDPAAYYTRPIALRNPIVFYEGHLPAFSAIAFLERGLGRSPIDAVLEPLFARGIDPETVDAAVPRSGAATVWPSREEVLAFAAAVDAAFLDALDTAPLAEPRAIEGLYTALEHEAMHQETLLYMWRQVSYALKRRPGSEPGQSGVRAGLERGQSGVRPGSERGQGGVTGKAGSDRGPTGVRPGSEPGQTPLRPGSGRDQTSVGGGQATLGARRDAIPFGWDNEFDEHVVDVDAFEIDTYPVTNAHYLAFVRAGGEAPAFWIERDGEWYWRGMFEEVPLPPDWPVYVSHQNAAAYAAWQGRRLPTEAEYHRAAFGAPSGEERAFPWGDAAPDATRGNFDFDHWEPVNVGSYPAGVSAWGVHDLVGNGWEWTSTVFAPFRGFTPMPSYPEYSADFFDGEHIVLKGASPATARELVRRSFRNWFRPNYPFPYACFRTVR